jgi:hypothetical protein
VFHDASLSAARVYGHPGSVDRVRRAPYSPAAVAYSGAGWASRIGQTYTLNEDWPKYQVADDPRAIDSDAKWSRRPAPKLKPDIAQHLPTHGRVGDNDEFLKLVTRAAQ